VRVKVLLRTDLKFRNISRTEIVFKYSEQQQFLDNGFVLRPYTQKLFWLFIDIPYQKSWRYYRNDMDEIKKLVRNEIDRVSDLIIRELETTFL
jgi:hypothetical protein